MKNIKNEEAVSPVIGVILMVVITVIVAAILAVFAFGIGAPQKAPEAQLRFIATNVTSSTGLCCTDNLNITNSGGDSLILRELTIQVTKASDGTTISGPLNMSAWVTSGSTDYLAPGRNVGGSYTGSNTGLTGDIVRVQIVHVPTGQLIVDNRVTVQGS
ncbi:Uncharacterised protein [uncultured archaeon]|nr:Uncharacterised protein [uncultured archaeon]